MPDWAENVITWDEVAQYIDEGTVESLGKLRRSEQQLTTYRAFMDQVRVHSLSLLLALWRQKMLLRLCHGLLQRCR